MDGIHKFILANIFSCSAFFFAVVVDVVFHSIYLCLFLLFSAVSFRCFISFFFFFFRFGDALFRVCCSILFVGSLNNIVWNLNSTFILHLPQIKNFRWFASSVVSLVLHCKKNRREKVCIKSAVNNNVLCTINLSSPLFPSSLSLRVCCLLARFLHVLFVI